MRKLFSFSGKMLIVLLLLVVVMLVVAILSIPMSRLSSPQLALLNSDSSQVVQPLLITNVHLVDVKSGQLVADQAVLIENGSIARIGEADILRLELGTDVNQIDGEGQFLTPGLVDAHVHVFDPQDLGLYLSHGITTVRNMSGMPAHLRWQEQARKGEILAARLVSYSPPLNAGDDLGPFHQRVQSSQHGRELVQKYAEMGYQGIKVYNGLSLDMTHAIIDEASQLGLPVAGHPSNQYPFEQVVQLPLASIEHVEELFQIGLKYQASKTSVANLTEEVANAKIPVVSTLVAFDNIFQASEKGEAYLNEVEWSYLTSFTAFIGKKQLGPQLSGDSGDWETQKTRAHFAITKSLFEKGAIVAIGTDTGPALTVPGLSFHRELELLTELEISNAEIMKAATLNSSALLADPRICGEIQVGCFADLLLLKENPLETLRTLQEPEAAFTQGHYLNREQLLELRKQGKAHHSFYTVLGWLLESLMQ